MTMKDIARELDVSISTVSRALKGQSGVKDRTRSKILQYASKHHYMPNLIAANLRSRSSRLIGVIIPEFTNYFFSCVLSGIEAAASKEGFRIIVAQSKDDFLR